ncbi:MAG: hypothetical protein R2911_27760 [Caldilineaceae bacterium]
MPKRQLLSAALIGLLILLVTVRIGVAVVNFRAYQMDNDEATHAARGVDLVMALVQGDGDGLWFELTKPHWYPPVHGLLLGGWLLLWGADLVSIRLYSTFCFLLFGALLWLIARQHGRVIGLGATEALESNPLWFRYAPNGRGYSTAASPSQTQGIIEEYSPLLWLIPPFFLVADALHSIYAAMSMLELPTILCAFGAIFLFTRAGQIVNHAPRRAAWLFGVSALLGLLCFWMKYSNGLLLLVTLFLSTLLLFVDRLGADKPTMPSPSTVAKAVAPGWILIALGLFVWLVLLDQARWVGNYANAQPAKFTLWETENLLYYPRLLVGEPVTALALVLTLITLPWLLRSHPLRQLLWPYLIFFGAGLAMIIITPQNNVRFIMPILPPLWVIGGAGLFSWYSQLNGKIIKGALVAIPAVVLLFGLIRTQLSLPEQLEIEYENSNGGVNDAYEFIAQTIDLRAHPQAQIALLGRADQWGGAALHVYLTAWCLRQKIACNLPVIDNKDMKEGWPRQEFSEPEQQQRRHDALAQADILVLYSEPPEPPDEWHLLDERPFMFERHNKEPKEVLVGVWERGRGGIEE